MYRGAQGDVRRGQTRQKIRFDPQHLNNLQFAELFYGVTSTGGEAVQDAVSADDIEASIQAEVATMAKPSEGGKEKLFTNVHLDGLQCVLFFKTKAPVEPVSFVHRVCTEVAKNPKRRQSRFVNRLTPMTLMGRASEKGLQEVGRAVLGEHFDLNPEGEEGRKQEEEPTGCTVRAITSD